MNDHQYEDMPVLEVIDELSSDQEQGLSSDEVKNKRDKYGWNAIEKEEESWIKKLLSHFWGPIPWMLEVACILAAIAGRWEDFGVIFVMLLINGSVGYWHESKAESAIHALKEKLSPRAR